MELGFETIGNATLICHDREPVLATDPWLTGPAYFGSWTLTHQIPDEQLAAIRACPWIWVSHGHPDHLSLESLAMLRDKPILLPDHYGGRIASGLKEEGFDVRVLETGKWVRLSDRVRILCVPDYCQDAVLLVEIGDALIVNSNDASDRGVGDMLRETVRRYEQNYLLCLTGHGDADMINIFDEDGVRVPPHEETPPLGPGVLEILKHYGIRSFVPFASMHKYQRTDSAWANEHRTRLHEHGEGFESDEHVALPGFVRVDLTTGEAAPIDPPEAPDDLFEPAVFGDDWSEELEPDEARRVREYFQRVEHLSTFLGFVNVRVGGKDNFVDIARERFDRGITFEVPRASLMTAVQYEVFDDLLIGNFMRTTLHGPWEGRGPLALYPDFTPFVTKYGDNGAARTAAELKRYFDFYRRAGFFGPGPNPASQQAMRAIEPYL